jgi:6-phosphofructokinase
MIKVVYFDDASATDYLYIYDGGSIVQTSEKVKDKSKEIANRTSAGVFAKLSWLPFLGGEGSTEIDTELSYKGSSLLKTTLSNTVLTDFLSKVSADSDRIIKFQGYRVRAHKNSLAFFKMFTPYLIMTNSDVNSEGMSLNLSRMDEALESGKGYYELIAENISCNRYVFRFNIDAFRNNYSIADLTKMDLCYYGIKVGQVDLDLLDIQKEFNFEQPSINSAFDIENSVSAINEIAVYDIMLAGVEI